jgi:hypothetical protein
MAFTPIATLKNTMENILEYVSRLGFLAEVRWPANNLRVTVTDGTVTVWSGTVTTVTTLSNQTSMWGYAANSQIPALQNMEATLANIDNIIIS